MTDEASGSVKARRKLFESEVSPTTSSTSFSRFGSLSSRTPNSPEKYLDVEATHTYPSSVANDRRRSVQIVDDIGITKQPARTPLNTKSISFVYSPPPKPTITEPISKSTPITNTDPITLMKQELERVNQEKEEAVQEIMRLTLQLEEMQKIQQQNLEQEEELKKLRAQVEELSVNSPNKGSPNMEKRHTIKRSVVTKNLKLEFSRLSQDFDKEIASMQNASADVNLASLQSNNLALQARVKELSDQYDEFVSSEKQKNDQEKSKNDQLTVNVEALKQDIKVKKAKLHHKKKKYREYMIEGKIVQKKIFADLEELKAYRIQTHAELKKIRHRVNKLEGKSEPSPPKPPTQNNRVSKTVVLSSSDSQLPNANKLVPLKKRSSTSSFKPTEIKIEQ